MREQIAIKLVGWVCLFQALMCLVSAGPFLILIMLLFSEMGADLGMELPTGPLAQWAELIATPATQELLPVLIVGLMLLGGGFIAAGIALLRLREWGRRLTIGLVAVWLPLNVAGTWLWHRDELFWLGLGLFGWIGICSYIIWFLSQPRVKHAFKTS